MKRLFGFLFFAFFLASLAPSTVNAQSAVVGERRDLVMSILPSGDVQVSEVWRVRFVGGPFENGFREIPASRVVDIRDWSIGEDGTPYGEGFGRAPGTYRTSRSSAGWRIDWWYPTTVDAERTFTLRYTLVGVLRVLPAEAELLWYVIEGERNYPVLAASIVVVLPESAGPDNTTALAYLDNRVAGPGTVMNNVAFLETGMLSPTESWAIRVRFPRSGIESEPPAWQIAGG